MSTKVAASFLIQKPGQMTDKGRKEIAAWLRKQARNLVESGARYNDAGAFRARYYYKEN